MRREVYDGMIKTPAGGISSSRVMAWDTWKFLKALIIIFLTLFSSVLSWAIITKVVVDGAIIGYLLTAWFAVFFGLLIAIYAPKQLSKISEVRELMNTAKDLAGRGK